MARSQIGIAVVVALAIAGCGGGSTPPVALPTLTPPPGNGGGTPPPSFNPSAVRIAEVAVPSEDSPVYPNIVDVGNDGDVYFGQLNANFSGYGEFGLFKYAGGTFTQTLPAPESGYWAAGVDAIDAHDSSTVMWSSSYQQFSEPVSFGDAMECGAAGGTATLCTLTSPVFSGFITSMVTASDGTIWTGGTQCCGGSAGGYPAQLPASAANGFALDLANGPAASVWGVLMPNGPIYEFTPSGAVANTYPLPSGSDLEGNHVIVQGADGALWFADAGNNAIGRLSSSGQVSEYKVPTSNSGLQSITSAADGGMWFTESLADKIGRIDTTGKIYEFSLPSANAEPTEIAAAPARCSCSRSQVWFTETLANRIGSATY